MDRAVRLDPRNPEESGGGVAAAKRTAILVGNPNVGKSALFGALTGTYATVSNYPGTTVEVMRGSFDDGSARVAVLDTPGTAGLLPGSDDEQATRDILLDRGGATVVEVCDAKNLRRGLLLAIELAEAQVPLALALNMADEARARGLSTDVAKLAAELGVPVVSTVAVQRTGIAELRAAIARPSVPRIHVSYGEDLERALDGLARVLPRELGLAPRALGVLLLLGDDVLRVRLRASLGEASWRGVEAIIASSPGTVASRRMRVMQARLAAADALIERVSARSKPGGRVRRFRATLDRWSTHRWLGLPILALVLFAAYELVGVLGAKVLVDFFENTLFAGHVVPFTERALRWLTPAGAFQDFLVGPAGVPVREHGGFLVGRYGLVSMGLAYGVAIVLPIVATFFVAFSILEDSGYLPRLSVVADRALRGMGLNGKAVLPMVLGLGCDTMATMTARILETKKERILVTLLLALGVPCSAQLAVIFAMLAGVRPAAAVWFVGVLLVVLFVVGWLAAKLIPGDTSDFVLELPPLRLPQAGNVLVKTVARIEWYLREALPLFLVGTLLLWGLDRVGGLGLLERIAAPVVVGLLDLPREAASAFILGFLRRDYAAAGLFARYEPFVRAGTLTTSMEIEIVVALTTITLFVPCIANFLVIVKERGAKTAALMLGFILPIAFGTGALVNFLMRRLY